MSSIKSLFAIAVISLAASGMASANDSVADARVRATLSEPLILGQAQPAILPMAKRQSPYTGGGMSVAALRVQKSLSDRSISGQTRLLAFEDTQYTNDVGKSVAATLVEHAIHTGS